MSTITESHPRTLTKTILYRVLSIISAMVITLILSAGMNAAANVALFMMVVGTAMYYIHDRVWLLFSWDRIGGQDSSRRSLVKTIVYRLLVVVAMVITARLFVSDDMATDVIWAVSSMIVQLGIYFGLERVFDRVSWGKVTRADISDIAA
jgi:uncharacterized membrane protein